MKRLERRVDFNDSQPLRADQQSAKSRSTKKNDISIKSERSHCERIKLFHKQQIPFMDMSLNS